MTDSNNKDLTQKRQNLFQKLNKTQQQKLSIEEKIEYLKAEQDRVQEIAKQKQNELKLKERKLFNEAKSQERKNDTRRKILLGAWVLHQLKEDPLFSQQLNSFQSYLNERDKELFKGVLWDD